MTRVTDLEYINSATNQTSFIVTHGQQPNELTRRLNYNNLVLWLTEDLLTFDQELFTTSTVSFERVSSDTAAFVSANITGNLVVGASTSTVTDYNLFVSNINEPRYSIISLRGYLDSYPASITNDIPRANPIFTGQLANGDVGQPLRVVNGNKLVSFGGGGFSGAGWHNLTGELTFIANETWQDNGLTGNFNTATNAGTGFSLHTYPPATSRHISESGVFNRNFRKTHINQTWKTESNISVTDLLIGSGISTEDPSIIIKSNDFTYQSHGVTRVGFINSKLRIEGVPRESSNYDNTTLLDSNSLVFVANRGGAADFRRNAVARGDTLGRVEFRGQYLNSTTIALSSGNFGGEIAYKSLEDYTASVAGSRVVVSSVNSGTSVATNRLELDNIQHVYSSNSHQFKSSSGSTLAVLSTGSFTVYVPAVFSNGVTPTRVSLTTSTTTLSSGSTATLLLNAFPTYALSKLTSTYPSRIRIYADNASMVADSSRPYTTATVSVNGMIVEVLTTQSGATKLFTPAIIGFNNDVVTSSTMYVSIENQDLISRSILLGLTILQLEQ